MTKSARHYADVPPHASDREIMRMVHRLERRPRSKPWYELELELSEELSDGELRAMREPRD